MLSKTIDLKRFLLRLLRSSGPHVQIYNLRTRVMRHRKVQHRMKVQIMNSNVHAVVCMSGHVHGHNAKELSHVCYVSGGKSFIFLRTACERENETNGEGGGEMEVREGRESAV
jgi:hypothetical protein